MSWSSDLIRERAERIARAEQFESAAAALRSSRPPLTAEQLDHLSAGFCDHRSEDERARCACECHRKPSTPLPLGGPVYLQGGPDA